MYISFGMMCAFPSNATHIFMQVLGSGGGKANPALEPDAAATRRLRGAHGRPTTTTTASSFATELWTE
jgi:hypothetical protein